MKRASRLREGGITLLHEGGELPVLDDALGCNEADGEGVHAADVGLEEVGKIDGIAPYLGVEVEATPNEASGPEYGEDRLQRESKHVPLRWGQFRR